MDLNHHLQNILRVPQAKDMDKMVMLSCESQQCSNVSILNPSETYSRPCVQSHQILVQHRTTEFVHPSQKPFRPPSNSISEEIPRRKKWDINTILGHILLLVFHLEQWRKISQTKGVSAEFLDEELE